MLQGGFRKEELLPGATVLYTGAPCRCRPPLLPRHAGPPSLPASIRGPPPTPCSSPPHSPCSLSLFLPGGNPRCGAPAAAPRRRARRRCSPPRAEPRPPQAPPCRARPPRPRDRTRRAGTRRNRPRLPALPPQVVHRRRRASPHLRPPELKPTTSSAPPTSPLSPRRLPRAGTPPVARIGLVFPALPPPVERRSAVVRPPPPLPTTGTCFW